MDLLGLGAAVGTTRHEGKSPSPFDALDGHLLAGPQGSHPLHEVRPEDLVRPCNGPVEGRITLDQPTCRVGETVTGSISLVANERITARRAALRMVGLRLVEQRKSESHEDPMTKHRWTEEWVEARGDLFETLPFLDPAVPTTLEPGQTWESAFAIPAPRLGPPSAHLGEAIVAWALDVRWDVAMHEDPFVAVHLPVEQHPDLIRAGVGKQGGEAMLDTISIGDASISVASKLPAPIGAAIEVHVRWPSAPAGRAARIELHRRTNAPNGAEGIIGSALLDVPALKDGSASAILEIPADAPPSFDGAGLEVRYVIRVLVDRAFRSDAAIERPIAIA